MTNNTLYSCVARVYLCSRNLGGKMGASITETLGVQNMGDLTRFSQAQLGQHFGEKTG